MASEQTEYGRRRDGQPLDVRLNCIRKTLTKSMLFLGDNLRPSSDFLRTLEANGALKHDDVIRVTKKDTDSEKVYEIIDILKKSPETAYEHFIEALEIERSDLSEYVRTIENTDECDGVATIKTFNLSECQRELKEFYLEEYGQVNLLPWIPEETKQMKDLFVDVTIVPVRKSNSSSQNIDCTEELVTLINDQGQHTHKVLVTGDAGSGKSTLTSYLAYTWAKDDPKSPLSKFSLVIVIRVKDIKDRNSSLVDIVFQHALPEDSVISKEGLRKYIRENAQDILFLIDGLDEDSCGVLSNESNEIDKILRNRLQRKSCVILTSRLDSVGLLGKDVRNYTQVKLEGFSLKNLEKYIQNFFQNDDENANSLINKLKTELYILILSSIPVLLLMVCILWQDQHTIPKTKTQLFRETISYMWKRYKSKVRLDLRMDSQDPDSDVQIDDELKELLDRLGKVALDGISATNKCNRYAFTESEFESGMIHLGCKVGILKKETYRAGLAKKTSVRFLHATFQYFCAAFHMASLLDSKKKSLDDFDEHVWVFRPNSFFISSVLDFCCGLQPNVTTSFIKYHLGKQQELVSRRLVSSSYSIIDITFHLVHIFESQISYEMYEQIEELLSLFKNLHRISLKITHTVIPSVQHVLKLISSVGNRVSILPIITDVFVDVKKTPSWIPNFLEDMNDLQTYTGNVESFDTNLDTFYRALSLLPSLSTLSLTKVDRSRQSISLDITCLLKFLSKQNIRLTKLHLDGFIFDEKVMTSYLLSIKNSIESITLVGVPQPNGQHRSINDVVRVTQELKQLSFLFWCNFNISSVIKNLRPIISSLEVLALCNCNLMVRHLRKLLTFLSKSKKLSILDLSFNANLFSASLVGTFIDTLSKLPVLEELQVAGSGLSEESEQILIRFARMHHSLKTLCIQPLIDLDVDKRPELGPPSIR